MLRYCWLLLVLLLLIAATPSLATEEYAQRTGLSCAACHLDPAGGGELTSLGTAFAASSQQAPASVPLVHKAGKLLIGYLHLLVAMLWFGTILYVHLILKPAYASKGLPHGEVLVGLGSMVTMGITGAILTHWRISSLDMLLHTRFGQLLLVKIGLYLFMVVSALFVVLVIGPRLRARIPQGTISLAGKERFSREELARCDGQEGRPNCFAYAGQVYDAAGSRLWKNGLHVGRHPAGSDLTEALKLAPHGVEKLANLPVVGRLDPTPPRAPLHQRVFFFMAYLNLGMVFVITLIVALWRWG